jgi:hypothetical protein
VLQPELDASGQGRKTTAQETPKTAYISGIPRQGSTYPESSKLTSYVTRGNNLKRLARLRIAKTCSS